jgi:hypothetical protein
MSVHDSWDYRLPVKFRGGHGAKRDASDGLQYHGPVETPTPNHSAGFPPGRRIGFRSSRPGRPEPCSHWWMYGGRCYYCGKEKAFKIGGTD